MLGVRTRGRNTGDRDGEQIDHPPVRAIRSDETRPEMWNERKALDAKLGLLQSNTHTFSQSGGLSPKQHDVPHSSNRHPPVIDDMT